MTASRFDWALARERLEKARLALEAQPRPEAERALLEERARALAEPHAPELDDGTAVDVVVFSLGGERFAVDAAGVLEAVPLGEPTPIPGTPDFLLGVVNHRGRVLPVLDLRRQLAPGADGEAELTHAVAVSVDGMTFGIAAETVEETTRERSRALERALLTVLDLEALAADPRLRIDDN